MPLYSIEGPDGNTYSIEGPEGATREQVIQAIKARMGRQIPVAAPVPQPEQSGILRQALDIPVQVIRGGVGGIRMLADVFGAGSSASESLKSADTWLADLLSAQAKNDQRQIAQILKDAEDKGVLDQVKAGLKAFAVAPVDTLSQALGSVAPTLIAGLATGPYGAALGLARFAPYAMPAVGAAMGVGDVKQSIYQSTKDAWKEKGYSEEFAEAKAQEAQAYSGVNLPSLGIAAGLGALASAGPLEGQLMGMLRRKTPEQITKELLEKEAREAERGVVARAGLGALHEGVPEFAQAAQSQLAQNLALIQQGFDTPLFQGVVSSGTVEGLAGAVLGGTLSLRRSGQDLLPGQNPGESDADFARRMSREIEAARREPPSPLTKPVTPTAPPVVTAPEGEDVFRFPDGSVGTLDQARAYAMNLPPEQRAPTLQSILTQRVPREKTVPPDLFTQPAEKPAEQAAEKPAEGAAPTKPVVAEKPEVVEPAKPPAVAMTKEEEEVAADAAKGKPEQSFVTGYEPVEVPLDQLKLSKEVPQFKADADQEGIVERLEGKFDRINTAPIQVWRRLDGSLEVISGRHRFDLAKRSGEKTIPAQIHDEATGFDADQASILDATLNIRDQQGKGRDYVAYFRKSGISEEDASARGLLARAPGKPAFAIAKNGSEELVGAHRADIVSDAGAAAIANAAPGDSRLQAVGIKAIQEGKSPLAAVNIIKAVQEVSKGRPAPEGGDLFGFDDSAMKEAEEMAKIATLKQNQIAQRLAAISGASRRPEIAKKEGIDIKDPEALKKREKELRQQKASWDNWSSSPDLVQEIRKEMEPKAEKPQEKPSAREAEPAKETKEVPPAIQAKIDALGKALQRIMSRYGLKDVALKLVADMKAEGEYASKVLSLALDAVDPVSALRHESIHALKELGFFTPAQWKSLERQAKEKWVDQYLKQKNVNRQPLQEGQLSRYDAYMKFYGGDEEAILEEAIADAFADFSATKAPPGMLQALLKKIQNFFQAVKEAFGAEPDAERIFKKVERGELRGKEVAAPEVAEAEEAKPSLRQVPLSTRGIMESSPVYAMDELGLKTTSEKKPGGIELFNDVRSIARALNNDTINREGAIKEKDYSIASALKLARAMADEISFQVGATAKTGTGLGWYSSNYPKSVKKLAKRFPELETDPYARTVFSALVAITSNGEKVATNVKNAISLYADIREGKAVVQPGSRRASAMENNLSTLKMLMDKFGPDLRAELMREITVKEMNAALRAAGEKPDTSYLADTKVPASAIYFGPKLGAFFSNLEGAEGYLTMDLWWTRTMNRMRGLLMPKATAASINKFRDLMDRPNATREEVVSATIPLRNKYEEFGFKTELEHLVGSKEPSSKSPDLPKWNRRARALAGPAYQQLVFEHRLEKLANTIHKNEFEMLEEAPFTASDRKFMYRTAREAQRMLRDNGIDLSLADIQAALWYYEKRLYQHLSGRKADDIGYDEAIEQLAGQGSGPAGPALVFNRQPAGGPGAAGAGTEADRLGGAGQAAKPSLRDASWSEDRIATLMNKYSYLQNGREKDTKAYAGFVRPEDFLAATTAAEDRGRLESEKTPLDVKRLAKEDQEIFLNIKPTDETGVYQIIGHEGRHRMMALRDAGVRSVPVVFYTGGTKNSEVVEEPYFKAQEFRGDKKIIKAQRGFSAMEMIPISWDQRNNIKETFGGKADVRFSLRDKLGLYSELESKVSQGPGKGTAEAWKGYINGLTQKGVKPEEIEWSGVRDWLDLQKGSVTKEDLLSYLKNGGVQVEETVLGGETRLTDEEAENIGYRFWPAVEAAGFDVETIDEKMQAGTLDINSLPEDLRSDARLLKQDYAARAKPNLPRYSQYTLPGGENYREVLLTIPDISRSEHERAKRAWVSYQEKMREKYDGSFAWRRKATKEENAEADRLIAELDKAAYGAPQNRQEYRSSHWTQANVIAHIRVNDRTDADGNKVLFVEEIQSDWGQEGKKKGFKGQPIFMEGMRDQPEGFLGLSGSDIPTAPFVTKTEGWLNLALKRIMVMAGEGGYDKVAFVNGDQSAERYDLSKQIDRIDYNKNGNGTFNMSAIRNGAEVFSKEELSESQLADTVGKELAAKMVRGEGKDVAELDEVDRFEPEEDIYTEKDFDYEATKVKSLAGLDLKVGGEGMKTFYDTIVPTAVKKLLPKVGGGQMESVKFAEYKPYRVEDDDGNLLQAFATREAAEQFMEEGYGEVLAYNPINESKGRIAPVVQPGFDVTPAMKERVRTTGLPRFSLRDTVNVDGTERPATSSTNKPIYPTEEGTKNFWRWFKDSAVVDGEGRPLVVYHGTAADFSEFMRRPPQKAIDGLDSIGSWFTDNRARAQDYGPVTMPSYLSLQKPLVLDSFQQLRDLWKDSQPTRGPAAKAHKANRHWGSSDAFLDEMYGLYDGIIIKKHGNAEWKDQNAYIAFRPEQIKSAIGNVGKFDPVDPSIKASLRDVIDPAIRARIDQTTTPREEKTFIKRITEAISPKSASSFRAAFLDRYNRLSEYDKELARQMGGAPLLADASSHAAALMSDLSAGVLAGAMGVHDGVGGIPVYVNGYTKIVNNNNTVKGPIAIFAPLAKLGDPTAYQAYQFWAGVKRGTRFDREGREQLFEKADIQKADDLRKQFLAMGVDFEAIQKEWIKFNDGLVQYLKDTGVLSEAAAKEFVKYSDYIPFYRQVEGEETVGPQIFASLSGVRAPKKLKESELKIGEFLETVVRNVQYSIEAGMKNVAAQRAVNTAVLIGQANRLNYASSAPNVIKVLENGLTSYYATKDPLFVDAMKSLNLGDLPFIGLLAGPANLLRNLVTKDPAFMLANMMRDSMSAWVSSGVKMTPIVDTLTNFTQALRNQSPEYSALLNSGVIGGYDYSQGVEISARRFDRALRKKAGVYTTGEKLARPFTSLWDALEAGTQASDAATRMEIYKKTLAETGNEAEALFRSLEVMNFNRKGNNPMVRVLTAAVPFLNARMQGLDVLYRAAFAKGTEANAEEIQKSFFIRGMTIAALSTMYWMLAHDDDEWKKQEQETRDNYWILGKVKIPIPFEIGVLFKVIPERILEYSFGDDTGKDFLKSMSRQLTSTLAFNPIPQVAMPVVEAVTNYSFFTGRPIVSQGLEDVAPAYQVGPSTSRIGELAGAATKGLPSALQLSPMKVDQMIRGYTGTLGGYMMDLFDAVYDLNTDSPKASKRFEQMPVIKRFAVDPEARGQVTAYYELKNSVDEAVRTANLLERNMQPQEWGEFMQENMGLLATKKYVLDLEKSMKKYREMKTFVRASNMGPQEKEDILLDISKLENNLTSNIQQIKKMIAAQ